jgi:glycosyltransferase involved in cell wall biosynthesis
MGKISPKPRIALFAMGVMGGGNMGYGIPVLNDLFERLSRDYELVYYPFSTILKSKVPNEIKVRQVKWRLPGRLKYLLISLTFALDHILNPFQSIFAIAIYPTAHWAIRLGKIFNRPVAVQIIALEAVSLPDIGYGNLCIPWLKKITIKVCKKADILVTVAEYQKTIAQQSLPTSREIFVLPLRVDYHKFQYRRRKISFPVHFIHIAYYSPIKDQDMMFRAFSQVVRRIDCHLTVIGSGFGTPKIQNMLKELNIGDKVTFTGEIDQSNIPEYFQDSHILLHTARFETGCAVIQEAMASGVAVCGTEVGILSDIGSDYATIVPPGKADQLAEKILELVNDPLAYQQMTVKAYEWIKEHDSVWSYQNYKRFIDSVLLRTRV